MSFIIQVNKLINIKLNNCKVIDNFWIFYLIYVFFFCVFLPFSFLYSDNNLVVQNSYRPVVNVPIPIWNRKHHRVKIVNQHRHYNDTIQPISFYPKWRMSMGQYQRGRVMRARIMVAVIRRVTCACIIPGIVPWRDRGKIWNDFREYFEPSTFG